MKSPLNTIENILNSHFSALSASTNFLYKKANHYASGHGKSIGNNHPPVTIILTEGLVPELSSKDQTGVGFEQAEVFA